MIQRVSSSLILLVRYLINLDCNSSLVLLKNLFEEFDNLVTLRVLRRNKLVVIVLIVIGDKDVVCCYSTYFSSSSCTCRLEAPCRTSCLSNWSLPRSDTRSGRISPRSPLLTRWSLNARCPRLFVRMCRIGGYPLSWSPLFFKKSSKSPLSFAFFNT